MAALAYSFLSQPPGEELRERAAYSDADGNWVIGINSAGENVFPPVSKNIAIGSKKLATVRFHKLREH